MLPGGVLLILLGGLGAGLGTGTGRGIGGRFDMEGTPLSSISMSSYSGPLSSDMMKLSILRERERVCVCMCDGSKCMCVHHYSPKTAQQC